MEINVQYFGKFHISYNGIPLVGEKAHKESQFNRLLLALFHAWPNGVRKEVLESFIIGEKELDDEHSALRIIVYKAKKKLVKLGLPDINLIYQEKGVYYWTKDISVNADCTVMVDLFQEAESLEVDTDDKSIEKRKLLYLEASYLYKGEFLELLGAEIVIAQIAKKYRELFATCVERAASLLEETSDWDNLENLGRFAATIQPYCNWETLVMEALVEKRAFEEATSYYADVVDLYLKDFGIYPSTKLMEMMDKLGDSMKHSIDTLDTIQEGLNEGKENVDGGYCCSFPVFKGIYQMSMRLMERTGQTAYLILCTIVDGKGNQIQNEVRLEELSKRLSEAIHGSVRHGDMYTRYGNSQYLILLTNTTRENCEIVQNRINHMFIVSRNSTAIKYHVNSVICET